MLIQETKQLSLYLLLYHKIPENHILKLINSAISFKFATKLLENSYCKTLGRPAKKEFLEKTIEKATEKSAVEVQEAKKVLENPLFIEQKGIRSLVDKEARVGKKSHKEYFYGYKAEYYMTTEEGIITSVTVNDDTYVDGKDFKHLYGLTKNEGINIKCLERGFC